ncbi:ABC transporter substrate-binding protein [Glycomyces algeriensis]|uniref:Sugar ABC transporter substrate-binding protein n=1 Tax=Glycomyces algeriensis TaxID=256037 RepID=A0A9W6GAW0_9ACTN|nr:extracellular solute-binding protein [Glycomyces algeriensis]MDA1364726.1 extracellular solute-binding protein [Glycomyces algeriensis]MDR7350767.1 multiple sugar transport system substrate-binding protein [Glycomyces algeriensis]GLI43477.1 sugar ABC transporter substrate-binding protein [Glycomyces algeriensis]
MRITPLFRGRGAHAARAIAVGTVAALATTACIGGGGSSDSGRVEIRWFVGMGAGTDAPTIPAQEAVVEEFNASQDEIELVLEVVDADQAPNILSTQIATGDAPDIVGPMGIRGRSSFPGAWLDLTPHIEENDYDLSDFDQALVDFYRIEEEGQIGLPFAVFPSFMYVNLDLFDEAGLPYPPQEYGAPYIDADGNEKPWDIATMTELAKRLTVDADGNDANSPDFDPGNIVQFGFGNLHADIRAQSTLFGAGSLVDAEGDAQIPEHWVEAQQWYYDGMWKDHFMPNGPYGESDMLNAGSWFESGNLAMGNTHLWYATCCMGGFEGSWDTAAVPSFNGTTTAKLHADTFSITKDTEHADEAFTVLTHLLGDAAEELTTTYGGMPARISLQDGYFDRVGAASFEGQDINWDTAIEGMSYVDNPPHEGGMPNFLEAEAVLAEYGTRFTQEEGLDIPAELEALRADLQAVFDAA